MKILLYEYICKHHWSWEDKQTTQPFCVVKLDTRLNPNWVIASCFDPMIMEKVLSKLWNSICKSVPVHTWYGYVRKTAKSFDDAPKTAKSWDVCNIGLRHNESSRADRAKMNHKPITWEVCVHSGHWDTKESRELLPKDLHPLYS